MAVLEAALSRCALILNDIPSLREIWGPAAVYFRTNESESLAEAVRILSADVQLRRNFANRAFQRARESFNAQSHDRQLHSALSQRGRAEGVAPPPDRRWRLLRAKLISSKVQAISYQPSVSISDPDFDLTDS